MAADQRFHLLLGYADWSRCMAGPEEAATLLGALWAADLGARPIEPPGWDEERAEVTLPLWATPPTLPANEVPLNPAERRGAAADSNGNIYWIDDDRTRLRVRSAGDQASGAFWPDPRAARPPRPLFADDPANTAPTDVTRTYTALAATQDGWLVAAWSDGNSGDGGIGACGLSRFDLVGGGAPVDSGWPGGEAITASCLAPLPGGGLLLLDAAARRLFTLDPRLMLVGEGDGVAVPDLFQPLDGETRAHRTATPAPGRDLAALDPAIAPIAVAPLPGGATALLTVAPPRLDVLRADGTLAPPIALDFIPHDAVWGEVWLRGAERAARLVVTGAANNARSFKLTTQGGVALHLTPELLPMRRPGGRALVRVKGIVDYDSGTPPAWVPLVERPHLRFAETIAFFTPVFDGGDPSLVWDRLRLDAIVPPGTRVTIEARASDYLDPATRAPVGAWSVQPTPMLARYGHELAGHRAAAMAETDAKCGRGTWELLFQRVTGRYLQLRMTLRGDGDATPRLRALRASYPRESYAQRFLPAVYREDADSGDFIERFLANMEGTNRVIEARIAAAQTGFDPRTAPVGTLDWLADWFDVALDPAWDEARRRRFIAHAVPFFGWRGTVLGVESALALAFDACLDGTLFGDAAAAPGRTNGVRVVETFLARRLGPLVAGDPGASPGLAEVAAAGRWQPSDGQARLVQLVAASLGRAPRSNEGTAPLPLYADGGDDPAAWARAMQAAIGFAPTVGAAERLRWQAFQQARGVAAPTDLPRLLVPEAARDLWREFTAEPSRPAARWRAFLAGRYGKASTLDAANGTAWGDFALVPLPDHLPASAGAIRDWLTFEGRAQAIEASAHRFTVLLPLADVSATPDQLQDRARLARRIVELEKPAHTAFEVRFYWAMNRLGEARLGIDTTIGQGSRAPELVPAAVLGRAYLGESFVGGPPRDAGDGRVRLTR